MRTYKQNVIVLDEGDEVVVRVPDKDGQMASIEIARVGSDDSDFPIKTPHLLVGLPSHWAEFGSDGRVGSVHETGQQIVVGTPVELGGSEPDTSSEGSTLGQREDISS